MKKLEAFFIRHKFEAHDKTDKGIKPNFIKTKEIQVEAWNNCFAVIDYEEKDSVEDAFNPEAYGDWSAPKKTLIKVNKFLEQGGLLAISSNLSHPNRLLIGKLSPQSSGRIHRFQSFPNYYFKIIPLEQVKEVTGREFPSLFSKIPRQTTFTRWPSAQNILNNIYYGIKPSLDTIETVQDFLDASQLEVMCYEWLRATNKLSHLTLPIGRTMISVDIVGVDNLFNKVFAQVTFHDDKAESKILSLKKFGNKDDIFYYFCRSETRFDSGINYVSIEEVFNFFKTRKDGVQFLNELVGSF